VILAFASSGLESADAMYSEMILSADAILDEIPLSSFASEDHTGEEKIFSRPLTS